MVTAMEHSFHVLLLPMILVGADLISHSASYSMQMQPWCDDDESSALLRFKDSFSFSSNRQIPSCYPHAHSKVKSWNPTDRPNCCSWDGVECDVLTGKVIGLDLTNSCLYGYLFSNSTLFSLVHLQRLNLAYNHFRFLPIPTQVASFSELTHLNLSHSAFSLQIPLQISNLSKLVSLDLSSYQYNYVPMQLMLHNPSLMDIVQNLTNLKHLHLSGVNISSRLPNLSKLSSLESLHVESCGLHGEIPSFIGNLTNLKSLHLSLNNFFAPTASLSWLGSLSKLTELGLLEVNLTGEFPSSLMNLTRLSLLDLGYNHLTGPISSWLANMTELASLYLDNNYLQHQIPSSLFYLRNLKLLHLESNQLSGQIPSEISNQSTLTKLELFSNKLQGGIPSSLFNLKHLNVLNLHSNNLSGSINLDAFFHLKKLSVLMLSFNSLWLLTNSSTYTSSIPNFTNLGLSSCNLGEFPSFLQRQNQLRSLDLSSNNIHGLIPSWIWNVSTNSVSYISLAFNSLTGFERGPDALQWAHLSFLDLQSNKLGGTISFQRGTSPASRNKCKLKMIDLSENRLQGQMPTSLKNCRHLEFVAFGHNQLNDTFPFWLGTLPELKILVLKSNRFHGALGKINTNGFSKLQIIDLSHNSLTGELSAMNFENWEAMKNADESQMGYLGENVIEQRHAVLMVSLGQYYSIGLNNKGLQLKYQEIPSTLAAIDFSSNRFTGVIPDAIGNLTVVHLVNLSHNSLTGQIPSSLSNMKQLECMDLSGNQLSGEIPMQLTQLTSLSSFDVSYNNLSGSIPQGRQFYTFENDSYEANAGLCGAPLTRKCETGSPNETQSPSKVDLILIIVLMGFVSGLVIGIVAGFEATIGRSNWFMKNFGRERQRKQKKKR